MLKKVKAFHTAKVYKLKTTNIKPSQAKRRGTVNIINNPKTKSSVSVNQFADYSLTISP